MRHRHHSKQQHWCTNEPRDPLKNRKCQKSFREKLAKGEHFWDPSVRWERGEPPEDLDPFFYVYYEGKEGGYLQLASPNHSSWSFKSTTFYINEARPENHLEDSKRPNAKYFLRHVPNGEHKCELRIIRKIGKNQELVVRYNSCRRRARASDESPHEWTEKESVDESADEMERDVQVTVDVHQQVAFSGSSLPPAPGPPQLSPPAPFQQDSEKSHPPPSLPHKPPPSKDNGAFTAQLLHKDDPQFDSLKLKFLTNWTKPGLAQPIIERIFDIYVHPDLRKRFDHATKRGGNVERLFHGTKQASNCTFAVSAHQAPCFEPTCNVCSIVRSSFNFAHVVRRGSGGSAWSSRVINDLQYGPGLYFSPVSSKSHDYNNDSEKTKNTGPGGTARNWHCLFVADVAVGKTHVTKKGKLPQVSLLLDQILP